MPRWSLALAKNLVERVLGSLARDLLRLDQHAKRVSQKRAIKAASRP